MLRGLLRSLWMYYGSLFKGGSLISFYHAMIANPGLVFDIGAHVGNRSLAFARMGAQVVALEPQPLYFRFLHWLFKRNPHVTVLNVAAGAQSGELEMLVSENAPTVSSLASDWVADVQQRDEGFSWVRWSQRIWVQVTTLDALIAQFGLPDFCKIDVEGFELAVLQGLSQPLPLLSFEFIVSALDHTWPCIERLETLSNYEYNLAYIEERELILPQWVNAKEIVTVLKTLPTHVTSGDVYARLISYA
jgi:FkbM family methyltransferase